MSTQALGCEMLLLLTVAKPGQTKKNPTSLVCSCPSCGGDPPVTAAPRSGGPCTSAARTGGAAPHPTSGCCCHRSWTFDPSASPLGLPGANSTSESLSCLGLSTFTSLNSPRNNSYWRLFNFLLPELCGPHFILWISLSLFLYHPHQSYSVPFLHYFPHYITVGILET